MFSTPCEVIIRAASHARMTGGYCIMRSSLLKKLV